MRGPGGSANAPACRCRHWHGSNAIAVSIAPAPSGKRGARARLQPNDPSSHQHPDGCWQGTDEQGRPVIITWWQHLHLKEALWLDLTVIRVQRPRASNRKRDPRESWLVWQAGADAEAGCQEDIPSMALGYRRRFGQEHGYRFDKQALLWERAHVRTPEQFECWRWLVAIVHNQLVLARPLVQRSLRPWESQQRRACPQQVRRSIAHFLPHWGTPARPPNPAENRLDAAKER
jgi:hypothetical protein